MANPTPPPGFTLEGNTPAPPQGFKLEGGSSASAVTPPPPGFKTQKPDTGMDNLLHGRANKEHPNMWNVVYGLEGGYKDAATNGLMMQPARMGMEALGIGMDRVKKLYPGQSDKFYKDKLHDIYNQAVTSSRQQAHQQTQDNPYLGHQVANFGASVLGSADPTWFINPGAALEKQMLAKGIVKASSPVTRIAANAITHGGINSAINDVTQGMDILTGVKKDFDIQQNLEQAAFGAAFGGAHAGLGEAAPTVSKFVKGLFSTRGVDTLPSATPHGITTPLTTDNFKFNPEEQAQFKGLVKNGSVEDIKGFFKGRNGPEPTWINVNKMVEFRDQMPDQFVGKDNFHEAVNSVIDEHHHEVVKNHIQNQVKNWKNAPEVETINHVNDIADPAIREQAIKEGAGDKDALGFVGQDGKVRIFANRMDSPDTLNAVLYHEALGHYGLAQKFGNKLDTTLQTLMDRNVGKFKTDVDRWQKQNPGAYGGDRLRAAEEVLAEASQNGRMKPTWTQAVVSNVRQLGRQMGLKLNYSDAEINHILSMAHDAVINGKGRDVAANGFKGGKGGKANRAEWTNEIGEPATPNKFMFTGQKAKNFEPEHRTAFTPEDGHTRNEISDADAKLTSDVYGFPAGNVRELGHVLDHPKLFAEYPELKKVKVRNYDMGNDLGGYDPSDRTIHLNSRDPDRLRTVLHETQHAIQHIEGRIKDNEVDTHLQGSEEYHADPREKEAYATEARKDMTRIDRLIEGPPKFMNRNQLAVSDDYNIQQMEHAYNATDRDYVPTVRTHEEVRRAAEAVGFKPSQIKDFGDTPDLSKRLFRIQAAAKTLDIRMSDTLKKVDTPDWSPRDADNLRQMIADHSLILAKLRNERAEVARALNISKLGYTRNQMESFGEILKEHGGTLSPLGNDETLLRFARQMKTMQNTNNLNGMNSMVQSLQKPNWEDYLTTLHQNMMLSGLSTHVKAPQDMMIGIGRELMDSAASLPMALGRDALRAMGLKVKDGVAPTETAARLWGVLKAGLDAQTYRHAASVLKNGGPNAQGFGGKGNARIPIVSKVTDLISAQDAFFRAFATNMHLYGLGTRQALQEARLTGGKTDWDSIMTQGSNYAQNPSPDLLKQARHAADETLLLNKNALTEPLDRLKQTNPNSTAIRRISAFVANFLTPFVRVEANSLMTRVIRRSPLAFLDPQTIKDFRAGGARSDMAATRIIMGTASIAAFWAAAGKGKVTGDGPDNPDKKKNMEAGGWRANSVKDDGQYSTSNSLPMSFNPFDTHNSTATMVASLREAYEKGANQGQVGTGLKLALLSTFKELADMSWVSDLAPAIEAVTAPNQTLETKATHFAAHEAATMMPNLMGQYARVTEQDQPNTDVPGSMLGTIGNTLKAAVPGLRSELTARHDVYGNPIQSGASFAGTHTWLPQDNRVTGGNHIDEPHDEAEAELTRLNDLIPSALVTPVERTITVNKEKIKLNTEQFEEYQQLAGRAIVETVRAEMSTDKWQNMSDQERVLEVKDIEKDMKKAAREQLYGQ